MNRIAQTRINLGNLRGSGRLGLEGLNANESPNIFNQIISITIGVLTIVASIFFIFLIITGAYSWMTAGGDKGSIEDARKKILNGIIGLVIIIAAIFLIDLIGIVLGLPYILNPGGFVNNVVP